MPSTPAEEIGLRIGKLQALAAENGLDAVLVIQSADLFYFTGTCQDAQLFVPASGSPTLFVRRDFDRAVEETPLTNVIKTKKPGDVKDMVESETGGRIGRIGLELDVLPVNMFFSYQRLFEGTEFLDASPLIRMIRMVKSPYELGLIRRAAQMNDAMFRKIPEILKEGMSELEFAGLVEAEHRRNGHPGHVRTRAFNSEIHYGHIMSGEDLAVPSCSLGPTGGRGPGAHFPQGPGHRIIRGNEPVQIDHVAVFGGYIVDQARTFRFGEPSPKYVAAHETALRIQNTLAEQGRPGAVAGDLYDTALAIAEDAGLTTGFMGYPQPVPFVGHGVGLELDELPVIGRKSPTVLAEG
ncbi:MAG: Xaa-Pro peptidase family protein, partial [Pseudomonadota bacterium]